MNQCFCFPRNDVILFDENANVCSENKKPSAACEHTELLDVAYNVVVYSLNSSCDVKILGKMGENEKRIKMNKNTR